MYYSEQQGINNQIGEQRVVRLQRSVLQNIIIQWANASGLAITSFERIDDFPERLRHSCMATGIAFLPLQEFTLPAGYDITSVPVYFCPACGKVYLPSDLRNY